MFTNIAARLIGNMQYPKKQMTWNNEVITPNI